jgi:hypothetical protein
MNVHCIRLPVMVTTCEMQLHLSEGERRKIGVSFSAVSLEEGPQTSKSSEEETMIPQASRSSEDVLMMDLLNECREVPETGAVTATTCLRGGGCNE